MTAPHILEGMDTMVNRKEGRRSSWREEGGEGASNAMRINQSAAKGEGRRARRPTGTGRVGGWGPWGPWINKVVVPFIALKNSHALCSLDTIL